MIILGDLIDLISKDQLFTLAAYQLLVLQCIRMEEFLVHMVNLL